MVPKIFAVVSCSQVCYYAARCTNLKAAAPSRMSLDVSDNVCYERRRERRRKIACHTAGKAHQQHKSDTQEQAHISVGKWEHQPTRSHKRTAHGNAGAAGGLRSVHLVFVPGDHTARGAVRGAGRGARVTGYGGEAFVYFGPVFQ